MEPKVAKMTPAERMTAGRCPECGADLSESDILAHRDTHWAKKPRENDSYDNSAAIARYEMMTNYAAEHAKSKAPEGTRQPQDNKIGG